MNFRYKLNFKTHCKRSCHFCDDFGAKSQVKLTKIDVPRLKSKSSNYDQLLVPCNFANSSAEDVEMINNLKSFDQEFIFQVHIDDYIGEELSKNNNNYEIITDDFLQLIELEKFNLKNITGVLLIVTKKNHKQIMKDWFKVLGKVRTKIKFHFLQKHKSKASFLNCNSIYKLRKKLMENDLSLRADQFEADSDLYEPRVCADMELEACYLPVFEHKVPQSEVILSVVIPSYNNKNEVMQTIKHLNNQSLDKTSYEIILVDDGSTDLTTNFVKENFKKLGFSANFKLIHYPRVLPRKPGDKRFRAGLARNVGVKQALGEKLLFCDADIIFPKNSLKKILQELQLSPVVQIQRHYLKQGVKVSQLNKPNFNVEEHSFHPNKGYWRDFYADSANWMSYKAPWKYICTFGLALNKQDFIKAGRFRKVFLNYGFEDTDLGYRLFRQGHRFTLSEVKAYHQFGKYERNEYAHSTMKRHSLLSTTAKIFYRHYADPNIFEELPSFLRV